MFVLSPGLVWNPDDLKEGATVSSPTPEAKSLETGHPLTFCKEGVQSNKQTK